MPDQIMHEEKIDQIEKLRLESKIKKDQIRSRTVLEPKHTKTMVAQMNPVEEESENDNQSQKKEPKYFIDLKAAEKQKKETIILPSDEYRDFFQEVI